MRYATVFTLTAFSIAFWGFAIWVAGAFEPLEFAAIVVGSVSFFGVWMWWEIRHAMADPAEEEQVFVPSDWTWPAIERRCEDRSSVRHPGLGR